MLEYTVSDVVTAVFTTQDLYNLSLLLYGLLF